MELRFPLIVSPSWIPSPALIVRLSPEQNDVGRVDNDASDRVLLSFTRSEENVSCDNDVAIWSSGDGDSDGDDGSTDREGVTEPSQVEF